MLKTSGLIALEVTLVVFAIIGVGGGAIWLGGCIAELYGQPWTALYVISMSFLGIWGITYMLILEREAKV